MAGDRKAYFAAWHQKNKERREEQRRARNKANPEKHRLSVARWRANNVDHWRNNWLRENYGITLEQREAMLSSQGHKCFICRASEAGGKHNAWHTDHCHKTGRVRGILCMRCNIALGQFVGDGDYDKDAAIFKEIASRRAAEMVSA